MKSVLKIFFLLTALLVGCVEKSSKDLSCETDSNCPTGYVCSDGGTCLCTASTYCEEGKFCNQVGFCQANPGCSSSAECNFDQFCDTESGKCLASKDSNDSEKCTKDEHCSPGQICNFDRNICVEACRSDDDCPLKSVCNNETCIASENEICKRNEDCYYGFECIKGFCEKSVDGPYCRPCVAVNSNSCDKQMNHCLVSDEGYFCGVNCSQTQSCPNGFRCGKVVILTQARCDNDYADPCPEGKTCCPLGRECRIREGEKKGYCTCLIDENCPQDKCIGGTCLITGYSCSEDRNCPIPCVNNGCFVGYNCAPIEGLKCQDTLQTPQ